MAGATPVLERETTTLDEDRKHNALISENYAKLINPEFKLNKFKSDYIQAQESVQIANVAPVQEVMPAQIPVQEVVAQAAPVAEQTAVAATTHTEEPYRVDDARPDSPLWLAYSEMNQRRMQEVAVVQAVADEEENDDLRPTRTTIQYQTETAKSAMEEGATVRTHSEKRLSLSKRDKIVIAGVVAMIVALFVLIIVNSAIISGINSDINQLQSSLNTVKGVYSSVSDQIADYTSNLDETVRALAEKLGMVR